MKSHHLADLNRSRAFLSLLVTLPLLAACASTSGTTGSSLSMTALNSGAVPIPFQERSIPTVSAEPYFKVADAGLQLEGPSFDRSGNLLFVDTFGGRVLKLSPNKTLSTVVTLPKFGPAGIAVHKSGKIYVAGLGDYATTGGSIVSVDPDGSNVQVIVPESAGYHPDDIVFDAEGGFYFTDASGDTARPTGSIFYVSPDHKTTTAVFPNMALPNGIALSRNGGLLWADEFGTGKIHRIFLSKPGTIAPWGTTTPYQMIGSAPDSLRTDSDGNVYVALYGQGRILVFNDNGIPIGQILIPGRETGHNLISTSLAFAPGTNDIYLVSGDGDGGKGSWIWRAKGFSKGTNLYSHQ
jgi:lactonase